MYEQSALEGAVASYQCGFLRHDVKWVTKGKPLWNFTADCVAHSIFHKETEYYICGSGDRFRRATRRPPVLQDAVATGLLR